jgi:hypothetical protein
MPKVSWSTPFDNSTDAAFRAWGSDLSGKFAAAGLIKTGDSGQINWTTVPRPASSAFGGYEVWRFNDSLQSAAPVFLKIEYGSSSNQGTPALRVTLGTGSNGAGTLTGLVTTQHIIITSGVLVAGASSTNFPSYVVHTAGFFGLAYKMGASSTLMPLFGLTVQRSVSNIGVPTSAALMLISSGTSAAQTENAAVSMINFSTSTVTNSLDGRDIGFMPMRITASLVGLDPQIFLTWMSLPKMVPNLGTCFFVQSEVPNGTEFDVTLIGTSPRRYIAIGGALRRLAYHGANAVLGAAMLWED